MNRSESQEMIEAASATQGKSCRSQPLKMSTKGRSIKNNIVHHYFLLSVCPSQPRLSYKASGSMFVKLKDLVIIRDCQ